MGVENAVRPNTTTQQQNKLDEKLCGVFGRKDAIQHVHTQMIHWHGPTGTVFSVDIQPKKAQKDIQRLATSGSDKTVQVWELKKNEKGIGYVEHLSELARHDRTVNAVRFHPSEDVLASASDDRCLFVWRHDPTVSQAPKIFADGDQDSSQEFRETWTAIRQFRAHASEVYDLAWSPDGMRIAAATMDNAAYVWDVTNGKKIAVWQHHKGYVQGVAWDPTDSLIATVSSDRSVMVYRRKKYDLLQKISRLKTGPKTSVGGNSQDRATPNSTDKPKDTRMFLDTGMVDTFFRRPGFSPDGKLLALPCGSYEMECQDQPVSEETTPEDKVIQINVVYVFQHLNFEKPVLCLPTGNSPAIAIRFCPQLFQLREKKTPSIFDLPYRMVYAVATLDNVLLYDTQQKSPLASINSIHYEQLTDISWSADGGYLVISSIDGFCTIVTMNKDLLGIPYVEQTAATSDSATSENTPAEKLAKSLIPPSEGDRRDTKLLNPNKNRESCLKEAEMNDNFKLLPSPTVDQSSDTHSAIDELKPRQQLSSCDFQDDEVKENVMSDPILAPGCSIDNPSADRITTDRPAADIPAAEGHAAGGHAAGGHAADGLANTQQSEIPSSGHTEGVMPPSDMEMEVSANTQQAATPNERKTLEGDNVQSKTLAQSGSSAGSCDQVAEPMDVQTGAA